MKIDQSGAVLVATSITPGHSINGEKNAGGATGQWNKLRIATTKDKQLAVHVRGAVGTQRTDFVATGISTSKLASLRNASANGGFILPQVLNTARSILTAANMQASHLMTDQDLVRLAKLTASGEFALAEQIYAQAELEGGLGAVPQLTTNLLKLAHIDPLRTEHILDYLTQPGVSVAAAEAIMDLAMVAPQLGRALAEKAAAPGANQALAVTAAQNLAKIHAVDPQKALALRFAYPGHIAALQTLGTLADRITNGPAPHPASATRIFDLAVHQPSSAARLAHLLLNHTQAVPTQTFIQELETLKQNQIPSTTLNRLAVIGDHNLGVGQSLATLTEQARLAPGADPGLVSRLARQVSQDITTGGIITANLGAANINQDNSELIDSFHNLLTREFGATIANAVFVAHLQTPQGNNTPLSLALMQTTIADARLQQDAAVNLLDLQSAHLPTATYAKEQAALRAFNQAAQTGGFPDAERAELYRDEMLQMLQGIAPNTFRVDGTGNHSLLTKVAVQMAKKEFDGKILEALRNEFYPSGKIDYSYGESVSNVVDQGAVALAQLKTVTYPTLGHLLTTGSQNAAAYFNGAFANLHQDITAGPNPVGTRFFGGNNLAGGLTDVIVTSSDPHKKGERVLIFNFGPPNIGAQDRLLVYKPRDVRMDALLTGNRHGNGESDSLADIVNRHLGGNSVPTYNFLAGPGNPQNYGYVEYVPHGRQVDVQMTPPQAQQFYREYGRQAAMYVMMGARDLHQTNVYVSNHRPVFTDLELAVDPQSLEFLTNAPMNGILCDLTQAPDQSLTLASALQLDKGLFSRGESVRTEYAQVDLPTDRMVITTGKESEPVTESYVWVQGLHMGQNLDIDNARNPAPNGLGSAQQFGADAFEQGFHEVINILAQNGSQLDITNFIASLAGLQLRFHPMATGLQLAPRQDMVARHLQDNGPARQTFLQTQIDNGLDSGVPPTRRTRLDGLPNSDNAIATRIRDAIVSDLDIGDVAYFTRELGNGHRELQHHHPVHGMQPIPVNFVGNDDNFFADDGLPTLQGLFTRLNVNNDQFKDYVLALGSGFAEMCRTTGGMGFDSQSLQLALH